MSQKIPVTFTHKEKSYNGILNEVSGGGSTMFHLMVNNYYQGCLIKTDNGWQFTTQKDGIIAALGDYFGNEVEKKK